MRILHFSDLHIGVENHGQTDPATGLSTRLLDFLDALDELVEYALNNGVDLVLLAGDAYKGRDPSQTHQRELAFRLSRLADAGISTFLLVGNHDLPHAVGRATSVEIFGTLQVPGLHVGSDLRTYTIPTKAGPVQIVALPWPNRSKLLAREETRGLNISEITQEIERRITDHIQVAVDELDPAVPAVLSAHVTINGAVSSSEKSMMVGRDHTLFPSALHKPQLDYIALGHIHKHQVLGDAPMMVYSGSLQPVDFSEEGDVKGFCVVDLDPSAPQGRRLASYEFVPVKTRPFLTIDVKVTSEDLDPTRKVVQEIMRRNIAGAIVRVRITVPAEMDVHLRDGEIREVLKGAHHLASLTKEVQGERRTRISADAAEGLTPLDALQMFLNDRGTDEARQQRLLSTAEGLLAMEMEAYGEGGAADAPSVFGESTG
ncbi:MAG: exonuclease SbcCD subunit D [Dehalococcoidia bacterium]|nr:exonuclease SbcCD subunit D [Dehalococcoidia bacterium]